MNVYAMKRPSKINPVSVSVFFVLVTSIYLAWTFAPILWPLWQVSSRMRVSCVAAYRQADNDKLMEDLMRQLSHLNLAISEDNFRMTRIAYEDEELAGKTPELQQLMKKIGKECVIEFRYEDTYEWPIFGGEFTWPYESEARLSLSRDKAKAFSLNDIAYNSCTCTSVRGGSR